MGKKPKRELIDWFEDKKKPQPGLNPYRHWREDSHHVTLEKILSKPETRSNSLKIAECIHGLVEEGLKWLRKDPGRSLYYSKTSIVKSLRYVRDNFGLLEYLMNTGSISIKDPLGYMTWMAILQDLEPVGFDLPGVKRKLMIWKLQNEKATYA